MIRGFKTERECEARIGYKRVLRLGRTYELQSADRPNSGWVTESKHTSLASALYALAMSVTEADQKYQRMIDESNKQAE